MSFRPDPKDPDAVLDYSIDWTTWLAGDTLATSVWTVPAGITKDSETNTTSKSTVWLSGGTAGEVYEVPLRWHNQEISKGVLGQTMTSEDGSSRSQAEVHERVLLTIGRAIARAVGRAVGHGIVRPVVDLNWGVPPNGYPRVSFLVEDPEDLTAWSKAALEWVDRGLEISETALREKLDLEKPRADQEGEGEDDAFRPNRGGASPSPQVDEQLARRISSATGHVLDKLRDGAQLTADQWRLLDLQMARSGGAIDDDLDDDEVPEEGTGDVTTEDIAPKRRRKQESAAAVRRRAKQEREESDGGPPRARARRGRGARGRGIPQDREAEDPQAQEGPQAPQVPRWWDVR